MDSGRDRPADIAGGTLGEVLYADAAARSSTEDEWVALVRGVAAGDELALEQLYERAHRIVFTLAARLTPDRHAADEVTVDVFHEVWRRAERYDPADGTVVGWIMNLARSRSIDRVRHDRRKKRVSPDGEDPTDHGAEVGPEGALENKQEGALLRGAIANLSASEREAIELAYFSELTYAETAARLDEPLGTIKTRIRSALSKLRRALGEGDAR